MQPVQITLADGALEVRGPTEGLREELRIWRKEIGFSEKTRRRSVTGHYENLYSLSEDGTALYTMPGFAHRAIDFYRSRGADYSFVDRRTPFPQPNYMAAFRGLRPYQAPLVGRMLKSGGGILQAATGAGKTIISASIFKAYSRDDLYSRGTPTCVFACPDKDINRKNWEELSNFLPDREVGLVMSGARKWSEDIVCCTIDSLDNIDPSRVGLFICDEMHTASSNSRVEKISKFSKALRWGVSATPTGRFDGGDRLAEGLFGPVVARFSYQDGVKTGALVPITVLWLDCPPPHDLREYGAMKTRDGKIRRGQTSNQDFNQMVADIMSSLRDDQQTLCMVQFIEHMSRIHRLCPSIDFVHGETNDQKLLVYRDLRAISPKERKEIYVKFQNREIMSIFASDVYKQGVNFPGLNVVVNARGGGSDIIAKQIPGRASRSADGKDCAYVVDFVHRWDAECPEMGRGKSGPLLTSDRSRKRAYKELGFMQQCVSNIADLPFVDKAKAEATQTMQVWRRRSQIA